MAHARSSMAHPQRERPEWSSEHPCTHWRPGHSPPQSPPHPIPPRITPNPHPDPETFIHLPWSLSLFGSNIREFGSVSGSDGVTGVASNADAVAMWMVSCRAPCGWCSSPQATPRLRPRCPPQHPQHPGGWAARDTRSSQSPTSRWVATASAIENKGNTVLELQQRSIEFSSIIQRHQSMKSSLLERMHVLDEANYLVKRAASIQAAVPSVNSAPAVTSGGPFKLPNGVGKPAAPLADLLDLSSDDAPVTISAPTTAPNDFLQDLLGIGLTHSSPIGGAPSISTDILMDLLSIGSSSVQNGPPTSNFSLPSIETKSVAVTPQVVDLLDGLSSGTSLSGHENVTYPTITAFQSATLRITFSFKKQPGKPQETTISASFTNLATTTFTDFVFQAAVLKVAFASDTNLIPDNRDIK
ncbi:AP-1 complex subunit gamma-2 [Zea mays]|uniref:AP-1 complex subunit gamma-2 n=1 Tax=Zea mays TaxID=4577 RepID=UPI0009AA75B9|nr:AP-1 complex subunit gamma-2 [Zea mays]|eukprot:XP_020401070.1 AP-1 complex subunit gamma-2 [Zea mays]